MSLEKRAFYFPIERGLYEVSAGLKPITSDFGNGAADRMILQIDEDFPRYRLEKVASRNDDLSKYTGEVSLTPEVRKAAIDKLLEIFSNEYPAQFTLTLQNEIRSLNCHLTGETLVIDSAGHLVDVVNPQTDLDYESAFDALFSQIQEDGALVSTQADVPGADGLNWLSMVHVALPSHWDPRKKLGRDFLAVHSPVPGFERVARAHKQILDAMVSKGPFVRFVWSFVTDTRLNHHPEAPRGADPLKWMGRTFDDSDSASGRPPFSLRIERQVTVPLPDVRAALFFIRLSFIDGDVIKRDEHMRTQLLSALKSMSPESRRYKGVEPCFDRLIEWLS